MRWITSRGSVDGGSILDIVATPGNTTGVSTCDDAELGAGSASRSIQAGQGDGELLLIEADGSEPGRSHMIRELAIWTLGAVFEWLAIVPVAIGFVRVVELLRGTENSLLVGLLGEWSRGALLPRQENEVSGLLLPVGLPVLVAVLSAWLCFRLGRSLKQHSTSGRWIAVFLLAAACVPPLTLCFQAIWARAYGMAAGTLAIVAIPATFALALSSTASDALFTPEYRALVRAAPLRFDEMSTLAAISYKIGLIGLGVVAVMILVILAR